MDEPKKFKSTTSFTNEHGEVIEILSDNTTLYVRSADTEGRAISLFNEQHNIWTPEELVELTQRILSTVAPQKYLVVERADYAQLEADSAFLSNLEAAGVDNWDGYSIAREMRDSEDE